MGEARAPALLGLMGAWLVGVLLAGADAWGGTGAWPAVVALVAGMGATVWGSLDAASPRARRVVPALLIAAAAAAGVSTPVPKEDGPLPPAGLARIEGEVLVSMAGSDGQARSILRIERGTRIEDRMPLPRGALLSVGPLPLPEGARVELLGRVSPYAPLRNPSPHPSTPPRFAIRGRAWLEHGGVVRVLEHPWPAALLWRTRSAVRAALRASLDPRSAAMARALVLGDDAALDTETTAAVRDSGLLHVLAVSGLHVAILAGLLVAALRALLLRTPLGRRFEARRIACALGVPLALVYAAFAGGAPSAWRAAITTALAWSLVAWGRRPDPLSTTCAAALLLGAADPTQVARPAFLLSVVATVALVGDHREGAPEPARTLTSWTLVALRTSARATLATAPIVLVCFGSIPLVSVLANLILLPFGSLLLVQLSALHALNATLTPFGALTAAPFALCSEAFLAASAALGDAAPALVVPPLDHAQALVVCGFAACVLFGPRGRARIVVCALLAVALLGLELRLRHTEAPRGMLRITFVDVGQGDAALVDLPDGRLMLIDAGGNPGGGPDPGERAVIPLLAARRRARIDIAVITHPHPDHYGGLRALSSQLPISELWDNGQAELETQLEATSDEMAGLLRDARRRGTRVLGPSQLCGRPRYAGGARIDVLWPCPRHDPGFEANDNSLVLRIAFGARSVMFVGDAEAHAEHTLLAAGAPLRADVLKVGHHGSRTSTTQPFLDAVQPRIAVVSAGASNRFGHPHPEVMQRLLAAKATPIVLSQDGGTVVATDGKSWAVHTWKGLKLLLPPEKLDAHPHDVAIMRP